MRWEGWHSSLYFIVFYFLHFVVLMRRVGRRREGVPEGVHPGVWGIKGFQVVLLMV